MFVEDSKIYQDKIEERYTIEINRNIEGTDIMHPIPFEQTLDAVNSRFAINIYQTRHLIFQKKEMLRSFFTESTHFYHGKTLCRICSI